MPAAPSPAPTPTPTSAPSVSPDLAAAAAVADANAKSNPLAQPRSDKKYPPRAYVRSKGGDMLHLWTNTVIDGSEKKIDLDAFAIAQIEAGKWEIVESDA